MSNINSNPQVFRNSNALANLNIKTFTLSHFFCYFLSYLLKRKDVLLTDYVLNINGNRMDLMLCLFFTTKILIQFKKRKKQKKSALNTLKLNKFYAQFVFKLFKKITDPMSISTVSLCIVVLNKRIFFSFYKQLIEGTKSFKRRLFDRRFNLYQDFLKISILYYTGQVNLDCFIKTLGEIFKYLSKIRHLLFLRLIKLVFKTFFFSFPKNRSFRNFKFKGVKFILSGKMKGKLRAKVVKFTIGSVPKSTYSKDVEFSKADICTMYGTFGLKLWIYKKSVLKKNFSRLFKLLSEMKISIFRKKRRAKSQRRRDNKKRRQKQKRII